MSWRLIGLLFCAVMGGAIGIYSTVVAQAMVEEVNKTRQPEQHISEFGWYPGRVSAVLALHRQAYPNGRRHIQLAAIAGATAVVFVLGAVCILLPD